MPSKLLSIVIPVYNLQLYVEDTIISIYKQNISHDLFETILIDDGSYDGSRNVLDRLSDKYPNLIVIHSKHIGVSGVRNKGIRRSTADYIMFLDADDLLAPGSLQSLIDAIYREPADCIVGRSFMLNNEKELYSWKDYFNAGVSYDGMTVLESDYMRGSIWGLAISRRFINGNKISFVEGARNGEDSMFFLMVCLNKPKMVFMDMEILHKRPRRGSASEKWSLSRIMHYKFCIDYLAEQKQVMISLQAKKHIDRMVYIMVSMVVNGFTIKGMLPPRKVFNSMNLDKVFPLQTSDGAVRKWKMELLNKSPFIYSMLSWIINRVRN